MSRRLQLGTSRLEDLDVRVLDKFLDESWTHLGDSGDGAPQPAMARYLVMLRRRPLQFLELAVRAATGRLKRPNRTAVAPRELYGRTRFQPFYYQKGDRLAFEDGSFDYIFSEHFFNHLFFDEAYALLSECHRLLSPHGVLRTIVPDADLRTYEQPEPAGFPDTKMSFLAPLKHKTRWSVYMLSTTLRLAGFEPVPLRYCDRHGNYVRRHPTELRRVYERCPERTMIFDLEHVYRVDSLIVDGVKLADRRPAVVEASGVTETLR